MPKLLVVDDEIDIRDFAKRFFSKRGIVVLTASNGLDALSLIEQEKPDLVLLDLLMEGMTGIDVLKELRSRGNDVKVMIVTGSEREEDIQEAHRWNVRGFIHKPLILEEFEKIVLEQLQG